MKRTRKNSRLFRVLNVRRALPLLESNTSLKLFNQLTRVHFILSFFFYAEVTIVLSLDLNSSKDYAARCGLLLSFFFIFYSTFSLVDFILSLRILSSKPPPYLFAYSYILNFF